MFERTTRRLQPDGRLRRPPLRRNRWPSSTCLPLRSMQYHRPRPVTKWSTRERLTLVLAFTLVNAGIVLSSLLSDEFSKIPDKWLIGLLTSATVPIIFVAFLEFSFRLLEKSNIEWGQGIGFYLVEGVLLAVLGTLDILVFILLGNLRRRLGAVDYGTAITIASVVIGDVAGIITIYQFAVRRRQ